ncbi:hypothetical protein JW859_13530, partial [bacterium]|nr:hypothetical protein [bacterium]
DGRTPRKGLLFAIIAAVVNYAILIGYFFLQRLIDETNWFWGMATGTAWLFIGLIILTVIAAWWLAVGLLARTVLRVTWLTALSIASRGVMFNLLAFVLIVPVLMPNYICLGLAGSTGNADEASALRLVAMTVLL